MHTLNWRVLLAMSVILVGSQAAGAACETSRDDAGKYFTTCLYRIEGKPPTRDFEVKFVGDGAKYSLELPDLVPDKYKYFLSGNQVDVYMDVRNDGRAPSRATTAAVTIEMWDPTRATQYGNDVELSAPVAVIAAGVTTRVYLGTIVLPNMIDDFDLVSAGFVDPPSSAQAPYGVVFESSEMNNAKGHACRVFGTNPVLIPTPPPVCN